MDIRTSLIKILLVSIICLLLVSCSKAGPDLVSQRKAINLAKKELGLVEIQQVELSTALPIYHMVIGKTADGTEMAVWIDREIVYYVALSEGITKEEAMYIAQIGRAHV